MPSQPRRRSKRLRESVGMTDHDQGERAAADRVADQSVPLRPVFRLQWKPVSGAELGLRVEEELSNVHARAKSVRGE